jgi:hypothetical protein
MLFLIFYVVLNSSILREINKIHTFHPQGIGGTPKGGYTATSTNVTATGYTWDGARNSAL